MVQFADAFAAGATSDDYGAYHLNHLLITTRDDFVALWRDIAEAPLDDAKRDSEDADAAISRFTILHEMRHFHDCFSTLSGIDLFVSYCEILDRFYALIMELGRSGIKWRLPLTTWLRDADCPKPVKEFSAVYNAVENARQAFVAAFSPSLQPVTEITDDLFVRITHPPSSLSINAFVAHGAWKYPGSPELTTWRAFLPLGFAALLEANAHALLRDLAAQLNPNIRQQVERRFNTRNVKDDEFLTTEAHFEATAVYNAVDVALSKFIRTNSGLQELKRRFGLQAAVYPRRLLYTVCDYALNTSSIKLSNRQLSVISPGDMLQRIIESITIQAGTYSLPEWPSYNDQWREIRTQLSRTQSVEQAGKEGPIGAQPAAVLSAFAIHNIIIPLIDARLETNHRVFTDSREYRRRFGELPRVPFFSRAGGPIEVTAGVPEIVQRKWDQIISLDSLMRQIMSGNQVMVCSRAGGLFPGLANENWAFERSCAEWMNEGRCDGWSPEGLQSTPKCRFALALLLVFRETPPWESRLPHL